MSYRTGRVVQGWSCRTGLVVSYRTGRVVHGELVVSSYRAGRVLVHVDVGRAGRVVHVGLVEGIFVSSYRTGGRNFR